MTPVRWRAFGRDLASRALARRQPGLNRGDHLSQSRQVDLTQGAEDDDAFLADPRAGEPASVGAGERADRRRWRCVQPHLVLLQRETEDRPGNWYRGAFHGVLVLAIVTTATSNWLWLTFRDEVSGRAGCVCAGGLGSLARTSVF